MNLTKYASALGLGFMVLSIGCAGEPNLLPTVLTDSNRDGAINDQDAATDAPALETLVLANIDDDNNDSMVDSWDAEINGNADSLDITRVTIGQTPDLPEDARVYIYVKNATAAKRVNIWQLSPEPIQILSHGNHNAVSIPTQTLIDSSITLGIEGRALRTTTWDGRIELVLEVRGADTQYTPASLTLTAPRGAQGPAQAGVWNCDPSWRGAGDGCDCGCGEVDPDCNGSTLGECDYFFCGADAFEAGSIANCAPTGGDITAPAEPEILATTSVSMRIAPVIFTTNLDTPERLHMMRITQEQFGETEFLWQAFTENESIGYQTMDVSAETYRGDRWVQDTVQPGYQVIPLGDGWHELKTHLQVERRRELLGFVRNELVGPDRAMAYPGGDGSETSLNYGGNLEVLAPHSGPDGDFPMGRMVYGGGTEGSINGVSYQDTMEASQVNWMDAQEVQGPALEISSEWLVVGHIDEFFQLVPVWEAGVMTGSKIVIASPQLATDVLEDLSAEGKGNLKIFTRRQNYETTVSAMLSDEELMSYNTRVQARIDSIQAVIQNATGLPDEDFLPVPVLFEADYYDGMDMAIALNPGIQNLVTAKTTLFIPDPEGPLEDGLDHWQEATRRSLESTGLTLDFVDVFWGYHVQYGEAHCGTAVERSPMAQSWWTKGEVTP